jgi:hypothetical protein
MRRQIFAWLLLAVFLPMQVLLSLHIHETPQTVDIACNDCVHHNCHGHLTTPASWVHDCVLCQFLTLPMLVAATVVVAVVLNRGVRLSAPHHCRLATVACGGVSLRGPPACLME